MFSVTSIGLDTEPAPDASQLARWAPHTHVSACSLWPTPRATDADKGGRGDLISVLRTGRQSKRRYWRTPTGYGPTLPDIVGGTPNPEWLEWLMGFPAGWTELEP